MSSEVVRTADGRELGVCQRGPDDGTPVFVLHGTPGSRFLRHVQGEYERQGVRTITYDRPGYGLSTRLEGRTVADSAVDVAAIADHPGLRTFRVAGISGGGPSALAAAAAMPDRVTRCRTIKGAGPHDAPDLDPFEGMSEEELEEWECAKQGEAGLAGRFHEESLAWAASLSDEIAGAIGKMLTEAFQEGLRSPWGMVDDYGSQLRPWGFDIGDVACPTKVMIARDDTSVPPAHGYWLADHLPAGEAFVVDGGHLGPHDEEEEPLLGWLASGR